MKCIWPNGLSSQQLDYQLTRIIGMWRLAYQDYHFQDADRLESIIRRILDARYERAKTQVFPVPNKNNPVCHTHKNCLMTAGYYIGGGMYICWLAALELPPAIFENQQLVGLHRTAE